MNTYNINDLRGSDRRWGQAETNQSLRDATDRPTDTFDQPATVNALVTDVDGDQIRIEYRGQRTWASVVCVQDGHHSAAVSLNKWGMIKARDAMNAAIDAMPDDGLDCDAEDD